MKPLCLILLGCALAPAQTNILTANGNNSRNSANLQEYQLSPFTVNASSFGKLGSYALDGQSYTQPLYAGGIAIPGVGTKNVVLVATMHNSVYAFDADSLPHSAAPLWHVNLGTPVPSQTLFATPYSDIANEVGILGTGAIDLDRGVLLVVACTLRNGKPVFMLHALDLASAQERLNGPVEIQARSGGVTFDPQQHLQRPGLLLANNSIYAAFGSHGDQKPWHGWIVSYDTSNLTHQNGVFLTTQSGNGGSIWQSGRGLAADPAGAIYALTGNGDYDGTQNFSQSFLRLSGAQPVLDAWYTPSNWKELSDSDFDLSAGPALIAATNMVLGADKAGNLYTLGSEALGRSAAPALANANDTPVSTGSIFNLAVWDQPGGALVFAQGSQDVLQCFRITGSNLDASPVSASSTPLQYSRIGLALSANGSNLNTGILWETAGNYNDAAAPGTLLAYQASDLSVQLWSSQMNPGRDAMGGVSKFTSPTIANGRVYVATFANRMDVYGVLPAGRAVQAPSMETVANAASYEHDAISPGEMVSIFGVNLGAAAGTGLALDSAGMVPTSLAGTRVLFDGLPAPVIYAGSRQVNAVVPFGLAADSTTVTVEYLGQSSNPMQIAVTEATPGIFSADGSGAGAGILVNQDGTVNAPGNPAAPGSVVTLYATGTGPLSPLEPDGFVVGTDALPQATLPVSAQVGGVPAAVLYAGGSPGTVQGVLQVNLQIPESAPAGDAVPLVLQTGERFSQSGITLSIGGAQPESRRK